MTSPLSASSLNGGVDRLLTCSYNNLKSLLVITSDQYTLRILLRHLLIKVCIFFVEVCIFFVNTVVTLHVSGPYNNTAFPLLLKILILAAVHRSLLLQTVLSIVKACCAFFLLAIISSYLFLSSKPPKEEELLVL